MRKLLKKMIISLTACAALCRPAVADEIVLPEETLKASFAYNFSKFSSWQDETGPMSFCLAGPKTGYLAELAKTEGKKSNEKTITVKWTTVDFKGCRMAAFSGQNREALREPLRRAAAAGALTVGDGDDFSAEGGMISLVTDGSRVVFDINNTAAKAAGVTLSSQMLRLARSVR